jgi:hypothetical protein
MSTLKQIAATLDRLPLHPTVSRLLGQQGDSPAQAKPEHVE